MRATKKRRQAEVAAASAELAPSSRGPSRAQLIGTRHTIAANLAAETTDPDNPNSSAAAKVRKLAEIDALLASE